MALVTYGQDVSIATGSGATLNLNLPRIQGATLVSLAVTPTGVASQGPLWCHVNVSDSVSGFAVFLAEGWLRTDGNIGVDPVTWNGSMPIFAKTAQARLQVFIRNDTGSTFSASVRFAVDQ